jgi:hypothetical protein
MIGYPIYYCLKCMACHFGLSCLAGWLGYYLTLTILADITAESTIVGYISQLPLVVASCFSLLAHILEDYTINKF